MWHLLEGGPYQKATLMQSGAALIRGWDLFESWRLLEEICHAEDIGLRYPLVPVTYVVLLLAKFFLHSMLLIIFILFFSLFLASAGFFCCSVVFVLTYLLNFLFIGGREENSYVDFKTCEH